MDGAQDRTTIGLAIAVLILYYVVYRKTGAFPWKPTARGFYFTIHLLPRIVFGVFLGMIVTEILPQHVIEAWLSDRSGWRGLLITWLAGTFTPIGMPFVLYPLAAGLMAGGAGVGPMVTFLTASALFGPMRIITFELPILGGSFLALRTLSVFWVPPVAGFLAQGLARFAR